MINYFVTGATGHLGRNVIYEILKREDVHVYALVLPKDKERDFVYRNKITFFEGNVLNCSQVKEFLSKKVSGKKVVIHCAGLISIYKYKDPKVMDVNVNGTKNMIDASIENKIDRFVYISSVDAIKKAPKGMMTKEPDKYSSDGVEGVYGISKAIASQYVLRARDSGLETVIIHPSAIFGPNDYFGGPINTALTQYLNGKLNTIVTGGYDVVDVRDVARGIYSAATLPRVSSSYILSGHPITIKELISISSKVSGKPSYHACIPSSMVKIVAPILEFSSKIRRKQPLFTAYSMTCLHQNYLYDHTRANDELGYTIRPLESSLKDTFKWIKERGLIVR